MVLAKKPLHRRTIAPNGESGDFELLSNANRGLVQRRELHLHEQRFAVSVHLGLFCDFLFEKKLFAKEREPAVMRASELNVGGNADSEPSFQRSEAEAAPRAHRCERQQLRAFALPDKDDPARNRAGSEGHLEQLQVSFIGCKLSEASCKARLFRTTSSACSR